MAASRLLSKITGKCRPVLPFCDGRTSPHATGSTMIGRQSEDSEVLSAMRNLRELLVSTDFTVTTEAIAAEVKELEAVLHDVVLSITRSTTPSVGTSGHARNQELTRNIVQPSSAMPPLMPDLDAGRTLEFRAQPASVRYSEERLVRSRLVRALCQRGYFERVIFLFSCMAMVIYLASGFLADTYVLNDGSQVIVRNKYAHLALTACILVVFGLLLHSLDVKLVRLVVMEAEAVLVILSAVTVEILKNYNWWFLRDWRGVVQGSDILIKVTCNSIGHILLTLCLCLFDAMHVSRKTKSVAVTVYLITRIADYFQNRFISNEFSMETLCAWSFCASVKSIILQNLVQEIILLTKATVRFLFLGAFLFLRPDFQKTEDVEAIPISTRYRDVVPAADNIDTLPHFRDVDVSPTASERTFAYLPGSNET
eukprot:TRINITY_DN12343_c0_g1_i1.p1 TRINITY_DN12343_c0_g1~~TRINITY_DN12343_c0_g1_i1.p1  ORF type:complete len:425 (-),score=32.99 TRINITY_DN12343_c0_g1_i1:39-1313(-)